MSKFKRKIGKLIIITAALAAAMHAINKAVTSLSTIRRLLPESDGKFYKWKFGKIYYKKTGSGSPLLLIHDLSVYGSSAEYSRIVGELEKDYTLYQLDLIGCGRSDKPQITYTSYLYVQLLDDFITNVIGEKTDVITSGLSSSFTIMASLNNRNLFDKLIMISPADFSETDLSPNKYSKLLMNIFETPILGTFLYHLMTSRQSVDLMFTEKYLYNPFHTEKLAVETCYEAAHRGEGNGRFLMGSILGHFIFANVPFALTKLDKEIYMIAGEGIEDLESTIENYQSLYPSMQASILASTAQMPHIERPSMVVEKIKDFLA